LIGRARRTTFDATTRTLMEAPRAGEIAWVELRSPGNQPAVEFYGRLLGWDAVDATQGFAVLRLDGRDIGAAYVVPGGQGWTPYVAVEHAGRTLESAVAAGGTVVHEARQIGTGGWSGTFADPEGTQVGVWQPVDHPGFRVRDTVGSVCRVELHTRRTDDAERFYSTVFGWHAGAGPGPGFRLLSAPDRVAVGLLEMDERRPDAPAWFVYFGADDVLATASAAETAGGRAVHRPVPPAPAGAFAILADPEGVMFGLVKVEG